MQNIKLTFEAARVNVHLTQKEACVLLGVSEKTLQNYENGVTKPNWDTLTKMAEVYQIPIGMLKCV